MTGLIDINRQCCDADEYLDMGYWCAHASTCYHNLRPIGNTFWFSIPYRLHTSLDILFYLQAALYLLVIAGFVALLRVHRAAKPVAVVPQLLATATFASILLLVIYPTFRFALSDTPGTLFFMLSLVLSLLASHRDSAVHYILSGLCFGIACLFRTAYLIPVLAAAAVLLLLFAMASWQRKPLPSHKSAWLLLFFIPVLLQASWTWQQRSEISFISSARASTLTRFQLEHPAAGYDTLLPQSGYRWDSRCHNTDGILPLLQQQHYLVGLCLLAERFYFYFGSDARHTYGGAPDRDYLDYLYAEFNQPGKGLSWRGMELASETDTSPLGDMTARRFVVDPSAPATYLRMDSLLPLPPGNYRFVIWLWAPAHKPGGSLAIDTSLRRATGDLIEEQSLATMPVSLTNEPKLASVDIVVDDIAYATVTIHPTATSHPAVEYFHAWGAKLELVASARGYQRPAFDLYGRIGDSAATTHTGRIFSVVLLAANLLSLVLMTLCLWRSWKRYRWPAVPFLATAVLTLLLQSLLVVPEQRFMQPVLAASWMFAILYWITIRRQEPPRA